MRRSATIALAMALAVLPAFAQDQQPDLGTEAQREAGKVVYEAKCAQCHGETGDAVSIATPYLRPAPRDFTSGIFKFRSTKSGELPTTADIERSIAEGMPYTSMPAWKGVLSKEDITNLAYYIKTFNDDFTGPYGVPERATLPKAPGYNADNLARGREVFEEKQCIDCHGQRGLGNGKSAPTLEDYWGIHIRPADLTKRWTFRNGQQREDIYRTFTTGLDGSPMPSYEMSEEDAWALVDYVWSLSESEPDYATMIVAQGVDGAIDLSQGAALFEEAPAAYFPVVGQVIEPGRSFNAGVNGIEVRAVYNADDVAFLLSWNDMQADTRGVNSLTMEVPWPDTLAAMDTSGTYADAVALLLPSEMPAGVERPYFMFGDKKRPMDIWYANLASGGTAEHLVGQGSNAITPGTHELEMMSQYDDGVWTVIFKRQRAMDEGLSFEPESFVPVAFTVWDGFNRERGNKRGLTSWYHVYMAPLETQSAAIPMLKWGLLTLLAEVLLVGFVRWRRRREPVVA